MIIGPLINSAAILLGALGGVATASRIPDRLRTGMPLTFGVASIAMGVVLVVKVVHMPVMVISAVLGALVGELLRLEDAIGAVGGLAKRLVDRVVPAPKGLTPAAFTESFVAILILFSVSGTGIFGALNEGMTGDASVLVAKSVLDLFTAAIFATTLGLAVATAVLPQLAIQLALALGAGLILPLTSPAMVADFSATGGVMMLATGLRIAGIKSFPVGNLLPGLILAMPLSALWVRVF